MLVAVAVINIILAAANGPVDKLTAFAASLLGPAAAMFLLCLVLCAGSTLLVTMITALFPKRYAIVRPTIR